jgi:hypothetical protein
LSKNGSALRHSSTVKPKTTEVRQWDVANSLRRFYLLYVGFGFVYCSYCGLYYDRRVYERGDRDAELAVRLPERRIGFVHRYCPRGLTRSY